MKITVPMILAATKLYRENIYRPVPELPEMIVAKIFNAMIAVAPPIPMILFCPHCGVQHIDAPDDKPVKVEPDFIGGTHVGYSLVDPVQYWTNPPHRSHLCKLVDGGCGKVFRPCDVATEGVRSIETRGARDDELPG